MPSKQVVDREKSSRKVQAVQGTHKNTIVSMMSSEFGAAAGEAAGVLVSSVCTRLQTVTAAMVQADNANVAELADDTDPREQRDTSAQQVRNHLVDLREVSGVMFGSSADAALGFKGPTPVDPASLHTQATITTKALTAWSVPAPRFPGMTFDKAMWLQRLGPPTVALGQALVDVAREEREAEATLVAKQRAIAAYDQCFSMAANLLSTLLETAGESELARRVRPSTRRPGQTTDNEQDTVTPPPVG